MALRRFNATDCSTACCYNPECIAWQMAVHDGQGKDRECLHGKIGQVDPENLSCSIGIALCGHAQLLLCCDMHGAEAGQP